jgi:hypothetical protein
MVRQKHDSSELGCKIGLGTSDVTTKELAPLIHQTQTTRYFDLSIIVIHLCML